MVKDFLGVQVKYKAAEKTGSIHINLRSSWSDRKGTHTKDMDKSLIDIVCVYCPETDECYYINPDSFNQRITINLWDKINSRAKLASAFREITW